MGVLHRPHKRWSNADGAKVGLWLMVGVVISLIVFTLAGLALNLAKKFPLRRLEKLEEEKERLEKEVERLKGAEEELRQSVATKDVQIGIHAADVTRTRQQIEQQAVQLRQRQDEISRLSNLEDEANRLRPRVGELQDELKEVRKGMESTRQELKEARRKNSEIAKKLAFADDEVVEYQKRFGCSS